MPVIKPQIQLIASFFPAVTVWFRELHAPGKSHIWDCGFGIIADWSLHSVAIGFGSDVACDHQRLPNPTPLSCLLGCRVRGMGGYGVQDGMWG